MLKNQRKDTYKLRGQSSELPPSYRFPPLREGNRAARPLGSPCEQGEPNPCAVPLAKRGEPAGGGHV
jgi:hypothetical protein